MPDFRLKVIYPQTNIRIAIILQVGLLSNLREWSLFHDDNALYLADWSNTELVTD